MKIGHVSTLLDMTLEIHLDKDPIETVRQLEVWLDEPSVRFWKLSWILR